MGQRDIAIDPAATQPSDPSLHAVKIAQGHYGVSVIDPTTGAEHIVYTFPETNGVATELYKDRTG